MTSATSTFNSRNATRNLQLSSKRNGELVQRQLANRAFAGRPKVRPRAVALL